MSLCAFVKGLCQPCFELAMKPKGIICAGGSVSHIDLSFGKELLRRLTHLSIRSSIYPVNTGWHRSFFPVSASGNIMA